MHKTIVYIRVGHANLKFSILSDCFGAFWTKLHTSEKIGFGLSWG